MRTHKNNTNNNISCKKEDIRTKEECTHKTHKTKQSYGRNNTTSQDQKKQNTNSELMDIHMRDNKKRNITANTQLQTIT